MTRGSLVGKNHRSDCSALEMGAAGLSETSAVSTEVHSEVPRRQWYLWIVVTGSFKWLLGLAVSTEVHREVSRRQ